MTSLNITTLLKHLDELRILLNYNCRDFLAINETRLDRGISHQDVKVEGYDVIRWDRTVTGRFGRGVCCYIRSDINYVVHEDLDNQPREILSIEIRKANSKLFVVTLWYRPPNSSPDLVFLHLDTLLGRLDSERVLYYFIGDMNCNLLSSDDIHARPS